jgi:butyryl-CoA dehydrogenase
MMSFELSDEQRSIQDAARKLAEKNFKPGAAQADKRYQPPVENLKMLRDGGFLGMCLPEEFGGTALGLLDMVLVVEQVARYCANTAILMGTTDGACQRTILQVGSERQKNLYLPGAPTGTTLFAWSMSEPDAGSDVGNVKTRAVRDGGELIVNGSKLWCSCAQVADKFLVLVRLSDEPGIKGVGAIIVERGAAGFEVGKHLDLMGLRATGMAPLFFNDCRVPIENIVVEAGQMHLLLKALDSDRIAGNPPVCLGVAVAAFEEAVVFVRERQQFGKALIEQQGIQWRLADMAIDIETARAILYRAAARVDGGGGRSLDASVAKTYLNEMSLRVTSTAMHLCGAYGLSEEYPFERYYRDVRGMSIGYGTTDIHRNMIAREILTGRYTP